MYIVCPLWTNFQKVNLKIEMILLLGKQTDQ